MTRSSSLLATMLFVLLAASPAFAQFHSGNVFGKVVDTSGAAVPGVTVTLSGIGAPQTFVTTEDGSFRFLALAPGSYKVMATLRGSGSVTRPVEVNTGSNSDVVLSLTATVQESITVSAETPLIDVRQTGRATTATRAELDNFPGPRNPWAVIGSAAGVLLAGNVDGKQSQLVSNGVTYSQSTFNIDGVNITDMAATGASPMYYDFDAYDEMQVTTASSDPRVPTAGVQLNMVTRRGTNMLRGSGRWYWTDHRFQSSSSIPAEAKAYLAESGRIAHVDDFGAEAGGPVIKDRLWAWAAFGGNRVDLLPASGPTDVNYRDDGTIATWNAKLNAQLLPNNSGAALYDRSEKKVRGRNVGFYRPPETGWNQSGPSTLAKVEDTHLFNDRFYVSAFFSRVTSDFQLDPVGGMNRDVWQDPASIWHGSFVFYEAIRPQREHKIEAAAFLDSGAVRHELKFGVEYRSAPVRSLSITPGSGNVGLLLDGNFGVADLTRENLPRYSTDYRNLFIGDTMLWDRLTLQVGARYDLQSGRNLAGNVPANKVFPDLLPAASYAGDARSLQWRTISPRAGLTYVIGENHRTLLRAAWNRYADQLGSHDIGTANPFWYQNLYYYWDDTNADHVIQRNEILFDQGLLGFSYVNLNNPAGNGSPIRIDYGMKPTTTDEFLVGVEQEITPAFTIGLNVTRRRRQNFTWLAHEKTQGMGDYYTPADYVLAGNATGRLPDGRTYSVPYYRLKAGTPLPMYGVVTNRPDYSQRYDGADLVITKRLTKRWLMRANASWNDWTQTVGPRGFVDPTELLDDNGCNRCNGALVEGLASNGAGINSRWSYSVSALAELPWRVSAGVSAGGAEGYPISYVHKVNPGDETGKKPVLVDGVDPARLPNAFGISLRLAKEIVLRGTSGVTVSADVYNLTNRQVVGARTPVLYTSLRLANPSANHIVGLQAPRSVRLGLRLSF